MNTYQFFSSLLQYVDNKGCLTLFSAQADTNHHLIEHIDLSDEDSIDSITETIEDWKDKVGFNIYYSPAIRRTDLKKHERGGLDSITSALGFVVDCDTPESFKLWSSNCKDIGLNPSIVVQTSSQRVQLVYLFKKPTNDFKTWKMYAERLVSHFGCDSATKDLAHIFRVPNTTNYPNKKKKLDGRTTEESIVIYPTGNNEVVYYDLKDFSVLPEIEILRKEDLKLRKEINLSFLSEQDIIGRLPTNIQGQILNTSPVKDRSQLDWSIAKEFIKVGASLGNLKSFYENNINEAFADKYRNRKNKEKYLEDTYNRAFDSVLLDSKQVEGDKIIRKNTLFDQILNADKISEFGGQEIDYWISYWLPKNSIVMVHGSAGCGKTYVLCDFLYCLSLGKNIGGSDIPTKAKILYIDFELSRFETARRHQQLIKQYGKSDNWFSLNPSFAETDTAYTWSLADKEFVGDLLETIRDFKSDIVVIDSARSSMLSTGFKENDAESWSPLNDFMMKVRNMGKSVIYIHHDSKAGNYSGSTASITNIDIELHVKKKGKEKTNEITTDYALYRLTKNGVPRFTLLNAFEVNYGDKNRFRDPDLHTDQSYVYLRDQDTGIVYLENWDESSRTEQQATWINCSPKEKAHALKNGYWTGNNETVSFIADHLGMSRTTITKYLKDTINLSALREKLIGANHLSNNGNT